MGYIGEERRELLVEPLFLPVPLQQPVPAEPQPAPEPIEAPAGVTEVPA